MAMHNAVLLTEENRQLRAANERQKKKRAKRKSYIAVGGVLTVQEGLNRSQMVDIEHMKELTNRPQEPRVRAPPRCSICSSLEHNARICP